MRGTLSRWTLLGAAVSALVVSGVALANPVDVTFARGRGGFATSNSNSGRFETAGFDHRTYVSSYHTDGFGWSVCYKDSNGSTYDCVSGAGNPTVQPLDTFGARGWCGYGEFYDTGTWWNCHTSSG